MTLLTPTEDAAVPTGPAPTVGRIVHYRLSAGDVTAIDNQIPRRDRNPVREGQTYPAQIVSVHGSACVNLVVQLDGPYQYWATSRGTSPTGELQPGSWCWPARA